MNVWFFKLDGKEMFHMDRPSSADPKAEPFVFEGLATDFHKEEYRAQYGKFLAEQAEPKIVSMKVLNAEVENQMLEASKPTLES